MKLTLLYLATCASGIVLMRPPHQRAQKDNQEEALLMLEHTCAVAAGDVHTMCSSVGTKCNGLHHCCEGLVCTGASFKRTCETSEGGCTKEGRDCSDLTDCCSGLSCEGEVFKRTCESALPEHKSLILSCFHLDTTIKEES